MKKLKTVTIGIPAHNEERNIKSLIISLLSQREDNYRLESIIIISDSSIDKTDSIVRNLSVKYSKVRLIVRNRRAGKISAVNKLFSDNTSDILVLFDADINLANDKVVSNLVRTFKNPELAMVGGVDLPIKPRNYFEKITTTWVNIWDTAKKDPRNKTTLHQFSARIMAFSKKFTKTVSIPDSVVVDDQYLYLKAKKLGLKVKFAKDAIVYYKIPNNLKDYLIQSIRYIHFNSMAVSHFDSSMDKFYPISAAAKKEALQKSFLKDPVATLLAIALQVLVRVSKYWINEKHEKGTWIMVSSTK